jgi:glycosyltransferase involved in cell wall biosynthesis
MPFLKKQKMLKLIKLESGDVVVIHSQTVGHLSGWIDSLYRASKNLPEFGVLSALILDTQKKVYFHGGFFAPNFCTPLSFAMGQEYYGQYPGTRQVDVVPFYCAIISKKLIEKMGIPETLGNDIFEDANYCLQAAANGFKIYTTDKLAVVYQGGPQNQKELQAFSRNFNDKSFIFKERWGGVIGSHYKYPVLYCAKVNGPSGFCMAARNYIRGLTENGVKVFFEPVDSLLESVEMTEDEVVNALMAERGDMFMPQIIWGQAPFFIKNSGTYKIGHCEFEGTEAPEIWIRYCNMMDEIWVPTEWDRKKFVKSGVNVPIYVIHQGIDPNYFHPDYAPMQTDATETFKFLVNAAWYPRKNLHNLIVAFQSEFKRGEDACLIIKTVNLGLNKGIKEELKDCVSDPDSANVYVKEEVLPDYKLPSLYTMADCFLMPTRGEAWGLPIFEALACGVPVITTGYGAPFEVLKDEKGAALPGVHFLPYIESMATDPYVYMDGKKWAEPDMVEFAKQMRYVFLHRREEKAKALETSAIVRKKFSWDNVTLKAKERLVDIYKNKMRSK